MSGLVVVLGCLVGLFVPLCIVLLLREHQVSAQMAALRARQDRLELENQQVREEHDRAVRRLRKARRRPRKGRQGRLALLSRCLATEDGRQYPHPPPETGPQHAQLIGTFSNLRNQTFRTLAEHLFNLWTETHTEGPHAREVTVWTMQQLLAEQILGRASQLFAEEMLANEECESAQAVAATEAVSRLVPRVVRAVQTALEPFGIDGLPDEVASELEEVAADGLQFVRDLLEATPPGRLLFPGKHATFDPNHHEAIDPGETTPKSRIASTIFPGYVIRQTIVVSAKARVQLRAGSVIT
jgi:hypothetical protein